MGGMVPSAGGTETPKLHKLPSFQLQLLVVQVEFVALQVLQLLKASDRVRNSLLHDSNAEEVPIVFHLAGPVMGGKDFFFEKLSDSPTFFG